MKLIRVRYGKKDILNESKEYQINGVGPVGTLTEFKEHFPNEMFEIVERESDETLAKVKAQEEYCEKNKVPFFAPKVKCYNCNKDIWEEISEEKASSELITGCPYCHRSFCD